MPFDEALYEVLEHSRYDKLTGRSVDIRGRIDDAILRFINYIMERFDFNLPEAPGINTDAVAIFFAALGGLVLVVFLVFFIRQVRFKKKPVPAALSDVFEEIVKRDLSASEWLTLSQQHYESGAVREAVRYRYIAGLVALHDKKIIRIQASKTNAQIANELDAAAPALKPFFNTATDCFHRIWFGYKLLEEHEFSHFSAAVEEILI